MGICGGRENNFKVTWECVGVESTNLGRLVSVGREHVNCGGHTLIQGGGIPVWGALQGAGRVWGGAGSDPTPCRPPQHHGGLAPATLDPWYCSGAV